MADILEDIAGIEQASGGTLHIAARNLQTGETVQYNADSKVKTASVIKFPMLVHAVMAMHEGTLDREEKLTLTQEEKVGGSGVLTQLTAGLTLSLRDVCVLMTIVSDNTGTNMVIERLGVAPINDRIRSLGLPITTLTRKAYSTEEPTPESRIYGLGVTTPQEMLELLTLLAKEQLGGPESSAEIRAILTLQQYRDGIPRLLPEEWKYAGKTGAVNGVRNDVGLVALPDGTEFAFSLFAQNLTDLRWTADNHGEIALARITHLLATHWCGSF